MKLEVVRTSPSVLQRNIIGHGTAALILLSIFSSGSFGQTPVATPATPPLYSVGPITDYEVALPNSSDVLRFRRGERYNTPDPTLPELGEDSEVGIVELPRTHSYKNPIPFDASDAAVVGTATAGQSYLSNDKRDIYSEFKLKLQEII